MKDFQSFVEPLIAPGRVNSLAQKLLELTSPGIPDAYQGTELWDLSLVDPDNRRPVDYELRRRLLSELPHFTTEQILRRGDEGLPKLWTVYHALRTRREHPAAFNEDGEYTPVFARGAKARHLVAYLRGTDVLVMVPRLVLQLGSDWGDTSIELPVAKWRNQFSGELFSGPRLPISDVLRRFPVALLVAE
jgi:(1->4)-alpha-D-glucan 1-alpha-D-glucosylmutase